MATVSNTMSTRIALDTVEAQASVRGLTQAVSSMTSAWKAQEAQLRTAGDYMQAAEAKYTGLGQAIEAQKNKIEVLKREQDELGKGTQVNAEQYLKYENQINQATAKLASLEQQQQKARQSMDYQKSGLADLQSEYRKQNDLSQSLVQRLKAEGQEYSALKEQYRNSKESVNNLNEQYQKQVKELEKVRKESGEISDAFRTQQKRVNDTATSLAHARTASDKFNAEMKRADPSLFGRLRSKIAGVNSEIRETGRETRKIRGLFKSAFAANIASSAVSNGLGFVKSKVSELISSSGEYVKYQQTMSASWKTLTGSAEEGQKMVDMTNKMAQAAANSTEMVDGLNKKLYAVTNDSDRTAKMTKEILILQDAFGQTDEAVENFGTQWSQMIANGKVQGQDMLSIINVFPKMKQEIMAVAGEMTKGSALTAEEYAKMQKDGQITAEMAEKALERMSGKYKDATKNFAETIPGLERTIKARVPAVISAFTKPFNEMKNPVLQKVGDWFSDPKIEDRVKKSGEKTSKALGTVLEAFSKAFKLGDSDKAVNGLMDRFDKWIGSLADYTAKNAPKILAFFKGLASGIGSTVKIAGSIGAGAFEAIKGIAGAVSGMLGAFSKNNDANSKAKGLSGSLAAIAKHKTALKAIGGLIITTTVGLKAYTLATKAFSIAQGVATGAVRLFNVAMNASPIGLVVTAITGIVTVLGTLYATNKDFRKWVNSTFGKAVKFAGKAWKSVSKFISKVVKGFKKFIGAPLTNFGKFASGVIAGAADMAKKAGKSISGFVSDSAKAIGSFTSDTVSKAKKGFDSFGKGVSSMFNGMGKKTKKGLSGVSKSAKKEMDKASKATVKSAAALAKKTKKEFEKLSKESNKIFKSLPKDAKKVFSDVSAQVKTGQKTISKTLSSIDKQIKSFDKSYKKIFDTFVKKVKKDTSSSESVTKKTIKKIQDLVNSGGKWYKTLQKNTSKLSKETDKVMDNIQKNWTIHWTNMLNVSLRTWNRLRSDTNSIFGKSIKNTINSTIDSIKKTFTTMFDNVANSFHKFWNRMKTLSGQGINAVISPLNAGISGINKLISSFGGSGNAIPSISTVKYASGTGYLQGISQTRRPITQPTLAMLNDGDDSPETGHREMVILPNGNSFIPEGRNVKTILPAGSEVLNATETKLLMSQSGYMRYASGTGLFGSIWHSISSILGGNSTSHSWFGKKITAEDDSKEKDAMREFIKNSAGEKAKQNFHAEMKFSTNSFKGLFKSLASGLYKNPDNQGLKHWKTMWTMAEEAMSEAVDSVAMGAVGDDYRYKHMAKDSGADPWGYFFRECVSFVASRLANLGVNPALFSFLGNGNQWVNAKVPHLSRPKPGVVGVYTGGPISSNHVDFVTAVNGNTFDGEEYNWMGNGQYHQFKNRPISSVATFLDFGVKSSGKDSNETEKSDVDTNSPLRKLIKNQTGKMFDWIKTNLSEAEEWGGSDDTQGTGVERWRSSVVKALKANGIDPTAHRVTSILKTIQRESNGDPNAQNNWDSNAAAGHPSIGLMQTIGPTFEAYKHKGHNNIRNGYDNLLAAIAYIKARYGTSDAAFTRVSAYGYANGGKVTKEALYPLAEGGMAEYIVPTDKAKRNRGWKLVKDIVSEFTDDEPEKARRKSSDDNGDKLDKLLDKVDNMIALLASLVAGNQRPVLANVNIEGKSFSESLAKYATKANEDFSKREKLLKGLV